MDATEEEVAAAQQAVETAQAAADTAKANAATAQQTADTAKANAANAQTAADNAKAAADAAQADAYAAKAAADAAQADVDALAVRVTTAETNITQNSEKIELAATKTEVEETLGGYSTTEEMQAAINLKADSITSTVDSKIEGIQIGGRNLLPGTGSGAGWYGSSAYSFDAETHTFSLPNSTNSENSIRFKTEKNFETETYTLSAEIKATQNVSSVDMYCYDGNVKDIYQKVIAATDIADFTKCAFTFTVDGLNSGADYSFYYVRFDNNGTTDGNEAVVYIRNVKLEKGNKATDWTPAPEDMATGEDAAEIAEDVSNNAAQITEAKSSITQLANAISSLVQGENGESLMTQTENGWVFNFAAYQKAISDASANISDLNANTNAMNSQIDVLNQTVENLGEYTDYIQFGVENGQPCIILGETDSAFKVVITNTEIRFMEGSTAPASISNKTLHIGQAEIEGELRQGGFAWVTSSNGNYGLVWKGV